MNNANPLLLFITLVLLFMSEASAEDNLLVEGKGYRDLIVGESKVEDVVRSLGEPDRVEIAPKAHYSVNYFYPKIGLRINFHDRTLNTLSTLPNFTGKTSKGITLKSSLQDIEATYGQPRVAPGKTKDDAKVWTYDEVIFWFKRSGMPKRFRGLTR